MNHPRPAGEGLVLVHFRLTRDEDSRAPAEGWPPPAESEGLWASPVGERLYRIENTPWFARDTANQDVVLAVEHEGTRWVMQKTQWSGHFTVRVAHPDPATVLAAVADLGIQGESADQLAALDIPPGADLPALLARLDANAWDYEQA